MRPQSLLRLATAAVGLALCACEPAPLDLETGLESLERPNIVLIVVDMLRPDRTGPYGADPDTTPELSRWAARGIVFERVLAQSSWTKMSMASLLTSLWPRSHGIREAQDALGDGALSLAEVLRAAGYATYAVQTNGWLDQSFGFHQGFDHYVFPIGRGGQLAKAAIWPHVDRVNAEAERLLAAHDADRPFFLYLHYMDVHEYAAPNEFKHFGSDALGAYDASIAWVDDGLRRVREQLTARGLLDRTLLVLASDHGETFGENGRSGHARNVLSKVLEVPLVLRLPFAIAAIRVPGQVRNIDLAPTLLELAGVPVPREFEGESLLPALRSATKAPERDRTNFAALGMKLYPDAVSQVAVSDRAWTFARNVPESGAEAGAELLFDRSVDPDENVNLIARESAEAERWRRELDAHLERAPAVDVLEQGVRIDPEIERRLRAMGYLR